MRLKVLIVPFFIILILILGIGYIKPDIDVIQEKKAELMAKEARAATVETVVANVASLNTALDTRQELEQFLYRYLPQTLNQDQVIDAFNFLAVQYGLTIAEMDLKQPPEIVVETPLIDPATNALAAGGSALEDATASVPTSPLIAPTFILTGSVNGSYENIKTFFDALAHMERFHTMHFFSIAADQNAPSAEGVSPTNNLIGTFEAAFGYLPSQSVASALVLPAFLHSAFDFSPAETMLERITTAVPPLIKGDTGRPNPFQ